MTPALARKIASLRIACVLTGLGKADLLHIAANQPSILKGFPPMIRSDLKRLSRHLPREFARGFISAPELADRFDAPLAKVIDIMTGRGWLSPGGERAIEARDLPFIAKSLRR